MDLPLKKIACISLTSAILAISSTAFSHTRLQTPVIDENSARHGSNYNNVVVSHGCTLESGDRVNVLGSITVFPDGVDSTLTVDGEPSSKTLIDYVSNWGSPVQLLQSKHIWSQQAEIKDPLGNSVGLWVGDEVGMDGNLRGLVPFRTRGVIIEPTSCAKSVTFRVSIIDVCKMTNIAGFTDETVGLWTPAVGSDFDVEGSKGYDSPATLKVNRTSDMPAECAEGEEIVVSPSAAQLNRDFPLVKDGVQVWPLP